MIQFRCDRWDSTDTPVLSNNEIRARAEALVGDYKPALLRRPGRVNGIHFLESYLGATVDFQDIYYDEGEPPIAGITVFDTDRLRVFDRERLRTRLITVKANTVLLDNATQAEGKEGFGNFTALHEAGHLWMHPRAYRRYPAFGQNILCCRRSDPGENSICCRKTTIGIPLPRGGRRLTPAQAREHQANVFAAYVMMPRHTFLPLAKQLIREEGFADGILIDYEDWETDSILDRIAKQLTEIYGVSATAAKIHLRDLNLILNYHIYEARLREAGLR